MSWMPRCQPGRLRTLPCKAAGSHSGGGGYGEGGGAGALARGARFQRPAEASPGPRLAADHLEARQGGCEGMLDICVQRQVVLLVGDASRDSRLSPALSPAFFHAPALSTVRSTRHERPAGALPRSCSWAARAPREARLQALCPVRSSRQLQVGTDWAGASAPRARGRWGRAHVLGRSHRARSQGGCTLGARGPPGPAGSAMPEAQRWVPVPAPQGGAPTLAPCSPAPPVGRSPPLHKLPAPLSWPSLVPPGLSHPHAVQPAHPAPRGGRPPAWSHLARS